MLRIILGMLLLTIGSAAFGEPVIQSSGGAKGRTQDILRTGALLGEITAVLFEFQRQAAKEAREENKLANAATSIARSRALLEASLEYIIGSAGNLLREDHKNELQQLYKSLEALKRQNQQNLPLAQVNIQIQEIINEIQRLREREEALQDRAKQKATRPDSMIGASVNLPPPGFIGTFAKTPPNYQPLWIYGIRPNGELIWYRKDSNASVWQGPKTVGTGWNGFKDVIPAGGNRFYALTQDAKLIWYRHDGFNEGSFAWPGPVEVGSGWTFSRIFSGGQGIVYAIKSDGTLLWYRNNDPAKGLRSWQETKVVGSAWNQFKDVFSTGQGAIYAVRSDGRLSLYQHDGYATGEAKWQKDRVVGTGWSSFKQIIPSSDGVIMGILPDGKLIWHKHLGFTAPNRLAKLKETWEGPVQLGSGWQDFQKVIALIPDPPKPPA